MTDLVEEAGRVTGPAAWVEDEASLYTRAGSLQWRSFFLGFLIGRLKPPLTEEAVRREVGSYLTALGCRRRKVVPSADA